MNLLNQPQKEPNPRPLLLIVDDEPGVTESLKEILGLEGYGVDTAADGIVALEQLQQRAYDLILSDVYMPKLNGVGFYRALEHQYPQLLTRIIFLTGDASQRGTQELLVHTRVPFLTKPFSLEALFHTVRALLGPHAPAPPLPTPRDSSRGPKPQPPENRSVMPPPTRLRRQAQRRVQQARITYLGWWMPGASRLMRAITAAILDARGLLPEMPARRHPPASADQRQAVRHAG